MKFVVSSTELLGNLLGISKVISSKNTLPILDNFLFKLEGNNLQITASDLETTIIATLDLENVEGEGILAIPARILLDTLKEFSDQPLTFDINDFAVVISSESGKFTITGQNGIDYPVLPIIDESKKFALSVTSDTLLTGISKTIFAAADDDLRPVMSGIFVETGTEGLKFVASDAHKLVVYTKSDATTDESASFILSKKPASLLKNILVLSNSDIAIEFDDKNVFFSSDHYKVISRLVDGNYPNYSSIIPKDNPLKVTVDRSEFLNSLKRVSIFSNQASNLVKIDFTGNQIVMSAQDIDFAISGVERINCQYDGKDIGIGFKSLFLIEILSHISSQDILIELSDPTRVALFLPTVNKSDSEDLLTLLSPMMTIN